MRVDPNQPIATVSTLNAAAALSMRGRTTMLTLLGLFASVALLLACIGLYGVTAYSVGQRTRELGVRIALGATAQNVLQLVLRDGLRQIVIGLVLGLIGAGFASQILASQLYGVDRIDPIVFAGVALALLLAGALACWLPARRATKVNPIEALRAE